MARSTRRASTLRDFAAFVGLPYTRRLNCYGLVKLVLAHHGVHLPDYRTRRTAEFVDSVRAEWVKLDRPEPLCVALVNVEGRPTHVGLMVGRGLMLHADAERGKSVIDRIDTGFWQVEGFYKYAVGNT